MLGVADKNDESERRAKKKKDQEKRAIKEKDKGNE